MGTLLGAARGTREAIVEHEGVILRQDANGRFRMNVASLGYRTTQLLDLVINQYGLQGNFSPFFLNMFLRNFIGIEGETLKAYYGTEMQSIYESAGVTDPDGVGLGAVTLKYKRSSGDHLEWLIDGQIIEAQSGRQYIATSTGRAGDYYTITVIPSNDVHDLVVSGGASPNIPTGSFFSAPSASRILSCPPKFIRQITANKLEAEWGMFRKVNPYTLKGRDLQSELRGPATTIEFPEALQREYGGRSVVGAFFTQSQIMSLQRLMFGFYWSLLYEQRVVAASADVLRGEGLVHQVAAPYRFNFTPSQLASYQYLSRLITNRQINNPAAGDKLTMVCGSLSYEAIIQGLGSRGPAQMIQRRIEPNQTMEEAKRSYVQGEYYDAIYTPVFGVELRIVKDNNLDRGWITPNTAPGQPNAGSHAWDVFIIDDSPIKTAIPDFRNPRVQVEKYDKVAFIGQINPVDGSRRGMQSNYKLGEVSMQGLPLSGQVRDFNDTIEIKDEITGGLAILEQGGVMHGTIST